MVYVDLPRISPLKKTCKVFQSKSMPGGWTAPPHVQVIFFRYFMRFLQVLLLRQCKIAYNSQLTRDWFSRSFTLTRQRAQIDLKKIHVSFLVNVDVFDFILVIIDILIELDDGKIYRKALYLMVKTMVSCRFSLKPIQWYSSWFHRASQSFRSTGLIFLLQFFAAFYLYIFNYEHYLKTPLVSGLQEFSRNETRMSETFFGAGCRGSNLGLGPWCTMLMHNFFSGFTDVGQFKRWSSRVGTLCRFIKTDWLLWSHDRLWAKDDPGWMRINVGGLKKITHIFHGGWMM